MTQKKSHFGMKDYADSLFDEGLVPCVRGEGKGKGHGSDPPKGLRKFWLRSRFLK